VLLKFGNALALLYKILHTCEPRFLPKPNTARSKERSNNNTKFLIRLASPLKLQSFWRIERTRLNKPMLFTKSPIILQNCASEEGTSVQFDHSMEVIERSMQHHLLDMPRLEFNLSLRMSAASKAQANQKIPVDDFCT
jgi:hypothetical protein